jgi:hypothetical protein
LPPTEKELLRAAIDELIAESRRWFDAADHMTKVTSKVKSLACDAAAFSFVDRDVGAGTRYEELRNSFEKITVGAERTFEYIGQALKAAATEFEEDDKANAHRVANTTEWRD